MNEIILFFTAFLAATFAENIIFTRALGTSWLLYLLKNPKDLWICSGLLAVVTTLSGAIGYPLRGFVEGSGDSYILIPMLYIACTAVVYIGVYFAMKPILKERFDAIESKLGAAAFNCAVLGGLLIPANQRFDIAKTLGYGLGMSAGFVLAVLIIGYGIKRLETKKIPKVFSGLPIMLIYLGLLSLAFYGLTGHQLPT